MRIVARGDAAAAARARALARGRRSSRDVRPPRRRRRCSTTPSDSTSAELGPDQLRVDARELEASLGVLEPGVLAGLRTAIANVRAVAEAQLRDPVAVELPQGQRVEVVERARSAAPAVYVPGGRAPYPSTVVMCAVTARVAGVRARSRSAPRRGPGGRAHPVILAACVLCGVSEVYRMGGAQAIAALAYGTESRARRRRDRRARATRGSPRPSGRCSARSASTGWPGRASSSCWPSSGRRPELVALDLLAQAEHGEDSPVWLISPDAELLEAVSAEVERLAPERPTSARSRSRRSPCDSLARGARAGRADRARAPRAGRRRGRGAGRSRARAPAACSSARQPAPRSATTSPAPTTCCPPAAPRASRARCPRPPSGAAWLAYPCPARRPARLAPAGAALARAEGFPVHAESMERRA